MQNILFSDDIKPVSEFRSKAAGFLSQVHTTKRPMVITQNGKGAAVLIDVAVYDAMVEKLNLLQDVEKSRKQIADGQGIPSETAHKILKARLKR